MASVEAAAETFGFQAEVRQLLHLMVHSLYSEREIFLRELISNASDANDKLRFEAIGSPELLEDDSELSIVVSVNKDNSTLTVTDNGIGMSRADVIEHLGTIAHSGTGKFLDQLTGDEIKDSQLIGQFGVGFYSAFIVASEVTVTSRHAGAPASDGVRWRSDGKGEFDVEKVEWVPRGTTVELHLKEEAKEFLDSFRLKALIRKYSDHISFPVRFVDNIKSDDDAADQSDEPVNRATALWTRPRTEISEEEYLEFYRHITNDFAPPLTFSHNRVEGKREFTSLIYIPSTAPFDLWNREAPRGLKLYVQRVFITDHATQFLPLYLRFMRGIVDARDISLNVSREMLQQDPHVAAIRTALTKRSLDLIAKLAANEADKYQTFWEQFGEVLKEGLAEDAGNRDKIAKLLRFHSTKTDGESAKRSLDNYIADKPETQDKIYYLTAESLSVARASPHLEIFYDREIEVLLLVDRVDEWMLQYLLEYEGLELRDITRGELDLDSKSDDDKTDEGDRTNELTKKVAEVLGDRVAGVRLSNRLKDSPACLVLGEDDIGLQMRQMLKAAGHEAPDSKQTLELNGIHPMIRRLEREAEQEDFARLAFIVFDLARLGEGRQLEDPAAYTRRLNEFLLALGIDDD